MTRPNRYPYTRSQWEEETKKMKIVFHLKNGDRIERIGCDENDMERLASQFNNEEPMHVSNLCVNPKEVICFIASEQEVSQ